MAFDFPTSPTEGEQFAPPGGPVYQFQSPKWIALTVSGTGSGDVVGPAGAVDNAPTVFNGVTGKLIKETTYPAFKTSLALVKGDVGLGNVDNTSDVNKPVSTATQAALDLKVAGPATSVADAPTIFNGTTGKTVKETTYATFKTSLAITKTDVGLGNVDNTSDANAPVSTAQQTALNLKADLASPTFTGDPKSVTPATADSDTSIATTAHVHAAITADIVSPLALKANLASPIFTGDPTAPTATVNDNDTSIATTAFVHQAKRSEVVSTLTDGATPALNAALGNMFLLTAAGDRTIAVPSNPTSGQKIIIVHLASGANRTLALNTGTGGFRFGTDITALTVTTSAKKDYIGAIYNLADNKWDVVAYTKGY